MKPGDMVCYLDRYYGIVIHVGPYHEYGSDDPGVEVYWTDTGFRSWEFIHLLEVISENR